jgi:hypothetical protein
MRISLTIHYLVCVEEHRGHSLKTLIFRDMRAFSLVAPAQLLGNFHSRGNQRQSPSFFRACQRSVDEYIFKVNRLWSEQHIPTCNSMMPYPTRIRRLLIPIFLIVLVLAATLGVVMHHHASSSADGCMLCHLVIAPTAATAGVCGLTPSAMRYLVQDVCFISRHAADQKPPRAPPV